MGQAKTKIQVYVAPDVAAVLRQTASKTGTSVSLLTEQAVRAYLGKESVLCCQKE